MVFIKREIVLIFSFVFLLIFLSPINSATPFIVGQVKNALDGEPADGHTVMLWNPSVGIGDNVTDIIGPTGNSGASNIYMIDCGLLSSGCFVGIDVRVKAINTGDNYVTSEANLTISGAGFQIAENLTLNSPIKFNYTLVDDDFLSPFGEIDLLAGSYKEVLCEGVIFDFDGEGEIVNASAGLFDQANSFYEDIDDNNFHYTNSSCFLNISYGNENEAYYTCGFRMQYYANSETWNCTVSVFDNLTVGSFGSNTTFVNPLLAIEVPNSVDFGEINVSEVSNEQIINVTNFGNVILNLSLEGYAVSQEDNLSMNCSSGYANISVYYMKYNLTDSNPGFLTLPSFESLYYNLTSTRLVRKFDLNYRQNDLVTYTNEINSTYWRIYAPSGIAGSCNGNIIFGAAREFGW